LLLWPQFGRAPTRMRMRMTIRIVLSMRASQNFGPIAGFQT
jgi:hypothetical protein